MFYCKSSEGCLINLSAECVYYLGQNLTNIGINTNTSLEQILQHINTIWSAGGGGGSSHIIMNSGVILPQRPNLNFTNGLTALDDLANNRTNVLLGGNISSPVTFTGSQPINFYNDIQRFLSLRLRNPNNTFEYRFVTSNITSDVDINIPLLPGNDTIVFQNLQQVLTNKTLGIGTQILLGGDTTGDLYSNVGGILVRIPPVATGNVLLSAGSFNVPVWGKVTSAHVDSSIQLSGQSWLLSSGGVLTGNNVISGPFSVTFTNNLQLFYNAAFRDSSNSFNYNLLTSALSGNINITLPPLSSNDTFVFVNHAQVISNKTLGSNTGVSIGSDATGDIYYRSSSGLLARLPGVAVGNVLLSGGVGQPPLYGKVTSAHVDSSIQLSGQSWLLASGGVLTGNNVISGPFNVTFTNSAQIFNNLKIRDSSDSFDYTFSASSLSANVNIIIPTLSSNDTLVFANLSQTISNKTLGSGTAISIGSDDTGDIYYRGSGGLITRLPDVATGNVLLSGGVGQPPLYGKVTSAHVDSSIQLSGLSWLLASGGTLTGDNTISGSFNIGFTNNAVGIGVAPGSIASNTRLNVRGIGTGSAFTLLLEASDGTDTFGFSDNGRMFIYTLPQNASTGHHIILRDNSTGEITKLGIGSGLSISGGNLISTGGGGGGYDTIQEEGTSLTQRSILNFIGNAITASDDSANSRTNVTLSTSPASSTSVVGVDRVINAGTGLTGGGNLSSDITLSVVDDTTVQRIILRRNSGSNIGQRRRINFIEGSNISINISDDNSDNEFDVTINAIPSGANQQIQFNDGGIFGGASRAKIQDGDLTVQTVTSPTAPSSGHLKYSAREIAGRVYPSVVDTDNIFYQLQTSLAFKKVAIIMAAGNSTTIQALGIATPTATGTATAANVTTANVYTAHRRLEYLVTTASTSAVAGARGNANQMYLGSNTSPFGGLLFVARFGPATGSASNSTRRYFFGLTSNTSAPTDADPSAGTTWANMIAIIADAADTNLFLAHRNGTGAVTRIDTGMTKSYSDNSEMFELVIYSFNNNSSPTVYVRFTRLSDGETFEYTITSSLPSPTTLLTYQLWTSVGGTNSVIGLGLSHVYIESNLRI